MMMMMEMMERMVILTRINNGQWDCSSPCHFLPLLHAMNEGRRRIFWGLMENVMLNLFHPKTQQVQV